MRAGLSSEIDALWLVPSYPWGNDGASGIFHRTQARALSRLDVNMDVVAPTAWAPGPIRRLKREWRELSSIPLRHDDGDVVVHRPRMLSIPGHADRSRQAFQIALLTQLLRHGRVPDLVHAHFAMPYGVAGVRLGRQWKRPVVVTLHGSDVNVWPFTRHAGDRELKEAVLGADAVIAVSNALADRTAGLTGCRPVVLPIGIDLERFSLTGSTRAEARGALGLPLESAIATFVGNLVPQKGVRELAASIDGLREDVIILVVGRGPLLDELRRSRHAQAGRLLVVGAVSNARIPLLLRASDVLVLPSMAEGLPTVVLEAGAAGVPVVASAVGGIPELLGSERGWVLDRLTSDAIASALTDVLDRPDTALARASRLKEEVRRSHDADRQAVRLRDVYEALV